MFVIVPNWNLSFKPKIFKTLSELEGFADKENMILTRVCTIEDSKYFSRKYNRLFKDIDDIFIGW